MKWEYGTVLTVVMSLAVGALALQFSTICDERVCSCDSYSRVTCRCTQDYEEVIVRPTGANMVLSSATQINIDNCSRVFFLANSLANLLDLRGIRITNVRRLVLNDRSLTGTDNPKELNGLRIAIVNSTVPELPSHCIKGRIDEVAIEASTVRLIRPFAFSSLVGIKRILISDSVVESIEVQAFKKFSAEVFSLTKTTFRRIPSRSLSDMEVTVDFQLDGIIVDSIASSAFIISGMKRTLVQNCLINTIEGEAFRASVIGGVTFFNNTVGNLQRRALSAFSAPDNLINLYGPIDILFSYNNITTMDESSLVYNRSSFRMKIDHLNINRYCDCETADIWTAFMQSNRAELLCQNSASTLKSLSLYKEQNCGKAKQIWWIILVVILGVTLLVAATVFLVLWYQKKRNRNLRLILPESRTYKETEVHVIIERAELITTNF